jgi:RES domain-containing protein
VSVELRLDFATADFAVVQETLRQCSSLASVWFGEVYRSATPRYARTGDIVTGVGSAKMGGRWNPPGSFSTVYASLQPEAAMSESLATFRYYGWDLYNAMPRVFRALEAHLSRVLDLRRPEILPYLGPWLEAARREDWRAIQRAGREPATQMIGRAVFELGLEGLLVPSFASPTSTNLVAFPGNFIPGSWIRVIR